MRTDYKLSSVKQTLWHSICVLSIIIFEMIGINWIIKVCNPDVHVQRTSLWIDLNEEERLRRYLHKSYKGQDK